jgi:hypothetical protein
MLILGGYIFAGFEIPERIPLGGSQDKTTHTLLGGQRIVDAMGPSERDITWSGRFQSADASVRAEAIDAMRIAGLQIPLIIDAEFRTVIITDFAPVYERSYQVPYSITVHVVSTPITPFTILSLAASAATDLATAAALSASFSAGA